MTPKLLIEAAAVVERAAELPSEEREAFYQQQCAGKPELLESVRLVEASPGDDRAPMLGEEGLDQLAPVLFDEMDEEPDPLVHTMVGPYRIEAKIGQGGMGRVYRALHTGHKGQVALKVLVHAHGERARTRLQREAELLERCRHLAIARILYSDVLPSGDPYFTMELVEGRPITEFCRQAGLGLDERLRMFAIVCDAVRAAHSAGVIHRDLKPSNTLVTAEGQVKLVDFGIAEVMGETERNTRSYISVAYAAPEHTNATTMRTDVYSLGVLLAELILGRLPFDTGDGSAVKLRERIVKNGMLSFRTWAARLGSDAPWLRGLSPLRWQELEAICRKAAAREPEDRYGSVGELSSEVELFLRRRPVRACVWAPQRRWPYVGWRFVTRHAVGMGMVAVGVTLLFGMAVSYAWGLRQQRNLADREAVHNQALASLMTALFLDGDAPLSNSMTSEELLSRGMRYAFSLKGEPAEQATMLETLGQAEQGLGLYAPAGIAFKRAIADRRQVSHGDSPEVAELLGQEATLRIAENDPRDALPLAQNAVEIDRRELAPDSQGMLQAQMELAQVWRELGQFSKAVPLLKDAMRREMGRPSELADLSQAANELSIVENDLGNLNSCITLQQESLTIDRKLEGNENPDIGEHLMSLANTHSQLGDYRQAETEAREAKAILVHWLPPGHHEIAAADVILGTALAEQGKTAEADAELNEALKVLVKEKNPSTTIALAQWGLGVNKQKAGQYARALDSYRASLALYKQVFPQPDFHWASSLRGIASVYFEEGKLPEAEASAREAYEINAAYEAPSNLHVVLGEILLGQILKAEHREGEARGLFERVAQLQGIQGSGRGSLEPWIAVAEKSLATMPSTMQ